MHLTATTKDGEVIQIPIDETRVGQSETHGNADTVLDKVVDEVGITLRLTTDELASFLARQCISILDLPQDTSFTYECSADCDLVIILRLEHAAFTEVHINLYDTFLGDPRDGKFFALLRHAGCELFGRLIDAGFDIPDGSCITGDFGTDSYQDYLFYGEVKALTSGTPSTG